MTAKQIARWTWIPVLLVLGYSGWVVYERRTANRRIEADAQERRAAQDREILEKLGSGRLKILMFYANPGIVKRGETTLLCYGVSNAKAVRIEPKVEGVGPAISRCVEAVPRSDTTYTLFAEGQDGSKETSSIEVSVN